MIYQYLLEIAGNANVSIYDYKDKFRKYYASMDSEIFSTKWAITYHLLKDLKLAEKPEYTRLIRAASTWGKPEYSVYEFNIGPIKHNAELIRLLLSISAIWGYHINIKERRADVTDAIDDAYKILVTQKNIVDAYDRFYKDDMYLKYIYIQNSYTKRTINEYGSSNMAMEVSVIDALIY